jgi:transcription elongation factor
MPLTAGEIIKVKQILKVSSTRSVELDYALITLVDLDAVANVRGIFIKWDALKVSDSPDRAGMTVADVIEWDVMERCHKISKHERDLKEDLAIAIGFQLDPEEVLAF